MGQNQIRNSSIVAHVRHGESTLANRSGAGAGTPLSLARNGTCGLLAAMLMAAVGLAPAAPPDLTIEDLRALATARRERLTSLRVSFKATQEPLANREAAGPAIRSISRTILIDIPNGRYFMDRSIERDDGLEPHPSQFAYDGEVESLLASEARAGAVDDLPTLSGAQEASIVGHMMLCPPQPDGFGIDDGSLESLLEHGVLAEQMEDVGGHACFVVNAVRDGVHYGTVWLDPEADLLPLKRVAFGPNGSPASILTVESAAPLDGPSGERVWLPVRWQTEIHILGQTLRSSFEADAESVSVNPPVAPSDFRVSFPPGTHVLDRRAGVVYEIGDSGEVRVLEEGLSRTEMDDRAGAATAKRTNGNDNALPAHRNAPAPPAARMDKAPAGDPLTTAQTAHRPAPEPRSAPPDYGAPRPERAGEPERATKVPAPAPRTPGRHSGADNSDAQGEGAPAVTQTQMTDSWSPWRWSLGGLTLVLIAALAVLIACRRTFWGK